MTYDAQRKSLIRSRQDLLVMGVRECCNLYAQLVQQLLTRTQEMDHADWVKTSVSVVANNAVAPDGTMTADTVSFNANGDTLSQVVAAFPVTSKAFTASCWMRIPSGSQTIELLIRNVGWTEEGFTNCTLTTTWTRFWAHKKFSAVPVDNVEFAILHGLAHTGTDIEIWNPQLWRNPSDLDREVKFPTRKRVSESASTLSVNASRCNIADEGDGHRCYYSRPTCQDTDNFNAGNTWETEPRLQGIREFRFCRKDSPLPLPGENVMPLLVSLPTAAQEIDPERAVTINERVTFEFEDDETPSKWNPQQANEGGLVNTAVGGGTFFRRVAAIYRNYGNPEGYMRRHIGYLETGLTEAGMPQRGKYLIRNYMADDRKIKFVCADRLKLTRKSIPAKIDSENYIEGPLDSSQVTFNVIDATELTPPGDGYTVTIELEYNSDDLDGDGIPDLQEKMNVTAIAGNQLTVQRGRWGTTAKAHPSTQVLFREIVEFGTERDIPSLAALGKNGIDIIVSLYRYAGIPLSEIDTATLYDERDTWLATSINTDTGVQYGPALRRTLSNVTDVETLAREIRDLYMLFLWVNDNQMLTGKVYAPLRPGQTIPTIADAPNILENSVSVDDNDESRLSRVLIAYHLPPGASQFYVAEDFLEVRVEVDVDAEEREYYGEPRQRALLSQWLQPLDFASAAYFTSHILSRFKHGARVVSFQLEVIDDDISLGDYITVDTEAVQDVHGNNLVSKMIVLKKRPVNENRIYLECLDLGLNLRYGFYAAPGLPDYGAASAADKGYGYYSDAAGKLGSPLEFGYYYW